MCLRVRKGKRPKSHLRPDRREGPSSNDNDGRISMKRAQHRRHCSLRSHLVLFLITKYSRPYSTSTSRSARYPVKRVPKEEQVLVPLRIKLATRDYRHAKPALCIKKARYPCIRQGWSSLMWQWFTVPLRGTKR
ncbi:unnamed protein product [Sphagnum tenellum]